MQDWMILECMVNGTFFLDEAQFQLEDLLSDRKIGIWFRILRISFMIWRGSDPEI